MKVAESAPKAPPQAKKPEPAPQAAVEQNDTVSTVLDEQRDARVKDHSCGCGGRCETCARKSAAYQAEENRAHAVTRAFHRSKVTTGIDPVNSNNRETRFTQTQRQALSPFTGALPSSLSLRMGPEIDRQLKQSSARGLARADEIWIGGPQLVPTEHGFSSVLVHEAAHVASGASRQWPVPYFPFDDDLGESAYEALLRQNQERERQETEGREQLIADIPKIPHEEALTRLPGITYRAEARGDIELAERASEQLLRAWLNQTDEVPLSLSVSFTDDATVDVLIERAEASFAANHLTLGGHYLAIAIVQLIRYANNAVSRRTPVSTNDQLRTVHLMFLGMQRQTETEALERIERIHLLLQGQANAVIQAGNSASVEEFEDVVSLFERAEEGAGPRVAEDLGTGGSLAPELDESPSPRGRGRRRRASTPTPESPQSVPEIPENDPEAPVIRADEEIIERPHEHLEGMTVFYRTGPFQYAQIRSQRYGVAGTFEGARRMGNAFFGRRSSVIVEEFSARDRQTGARRVKYYVLALNTRVNPPSGPSPGQGEVVGFQGDYQWIYEPAVRNRYLALSVVTGPWLFFPPNLQRHISQVQREEYGVDTERLSDSELRDATFANVDSLINSGDTQDAANQLTYVGADGFRLANAEQKTQYIAILLNAITFEQNERTIVQVFEGISGRDELRSVLHALHNQGILHKLHTDMDYAFGELLMTLGRRFGAPAMARGDVMGLLNEIRIQTAIPGISVGGDGEVHFDLNPEIGQELMAALEGFLDTISAAVTGIAGIILNPEAFFRGIGQLLYFVLMLKLSQMGNAQATRYVNTVIAGIARQLGQAVHGLAVIQQNIPSDARFVRSVQRNLKWRIIWEVVGLFVGVGEVVAFVDALKGARAVEALTILSRGARGVSSAARLAETAPEAARLLTFARRIEGLAGREAHLVTVINHLPVDEQARIGALMRHLDEGAALTGEALEAVRMVRRQADSIAEVQARFGGDLARAQNLWARARSRGMDGDALRRLIDGLPEDAAARSQRLVALEQVSQLSRASPEMMRAVANSPIRARAVESMGAENFQRIWNRSGGDPARADTFLQALEAQRTTNPVAWQRQVDQLRDPNSSLWGNIDPPVQPRTPEQQALLRQSGGIEEGSRLSAAQKSAETDIVSRSERRISNREGYLYEVDVGNGHTWRQRRDGTWCRFSDPDLCGTRIPGTELTGELQFPRTRADADVPGSTRQPDVEADPATADGMRVDQGRQPGMTGPDHPSRAPEQAPIPQARGEAGVRRHNQEVLDELQQLRAQGQITEEIPSSVPMASTPPSGASTQVARRSWQESLDEMGRRILDPNDPLTPRDLAETFGPAGAREVSLPAGRATQGGNAGTRIIDHFYPRPGHSSGAVMRESKNLRRFLLDSHTSRELADDLRILNSPAFADSAAIWRIDVADGIHNRTLASVQRRVQKALGEPLQIIGGTPTRAGGRITSPTLRLETPSGRFIFDIRIRTTPL